MAVPDFDIRQRLQTLIKGHQERKPPTHAQLIRAKLIDEVTPVRALLKALTDLPWAATDNHPVTAPMTLLQGLYAQNQRQLPADISLEFGSVWDAAVKDDNRERAFKTLEVAASRECTARFQTAACGSTASPSGAGRIHQRISKASPCAAFFVFRSRSMRTVAADGDPEDRPTGVL
jgi:hypothetical protein